MPATSSAPELSSFSARDAMHAPVAAVDPSTELATIAALMSSRRIHCVVVDGIRRDGAGEHLVWGVISDLDLVRGALEQDPATTTAGRLAGTEALCVDVEDDLETVASALVAHDCSHAVVVERERPAGVISTLDIAAVLGR